MSPLALFGPEVILALVVAAWFVVTGIRKLLPAPAAGRRAVGVEATWVRALRRLRGVLELLGGLAVAAGAGILVLGLRLPFPGLAVGVGLGGLAAWTVAESARTPLRPLRIGLAVLGFALAVFYAGFRD